MLCGVAEEEKLTTVVIDYIRNSLPHKEKDEKRYRKRMNIHFPWDFH